jgi:hypothetical protein
MQTRGLGQSSSPELSSLPYINFLNTLKKQQQYYRTQNGVREKIFQCLIHGILSAIIYLRRTVPVPDSSKGTDNAGPHYYICF